jgi:two-component system cell cycle sensor histidine kinase/response regulator CckA
MAANKEKSDDNPAVLVVDDDADVRAVTVAALEHVGCTVLEAASAGEALRLLDEPRPIDIVVTDIVMPGRSGFHVVRGAEARRPGIKVLVTSAYAPALVDAQLPSDRFLPKPFRVQQLQHKVHDLLRR